MNSEQSLSGTQEMVENVDSTTLKIVQFVEKILSDVGVPENWLAVIRGVLLVLIIAVISYLAFYIARYIIVNQISKIIKRSKTRYDDILLERRVFHRLAYIAPALITYALIDQAIPEVTWLVSLVRDLSFIWIIVVILRTVTAFLNALHDIYAHLPISNNRPITGYVQLFVIIAYIFGFLSIISVVFNLDMGKIFAGLGAVAAVLILVFKDTILGLVASVQLSGNNMVKPGDWIEVPRYNADGTVLEITLNTVKVQNWDKTISTIPTYALVSESFQNWKGMEESGGRRIKRSVNIDMKSVKFLNAEQTAKLERFHLLADYIKQRKEEIAKANMDNKVEDHEIYNGRRMTNLGTFRIYLQNYLKAHPMIHDNMTFLVRQLQPGANGIPMEIYVFSKDQVWANYEAIQADIFDHVLAIIPEFGLKVFQNPSGEDFLSLVKN